MPAPGERFVWRGDAAGRLSGDGPFARLLGGRSWQALAAEGTLREADALLAALAGTATFRALPAILALEAAGRRLTVALSGVPLARAGRPFAGFAGFGLVRAVAPLAEEPATEIVPESAEPGNGEPVEPAPALGPEEAESQPLSLNEHDAFHEIARALRARFAGDDAIETARAEETDPTAARITPFPGPRGAESAAAALLEGVPAALLVCRDGRILHANRRFLALSGHDDLAALREADPNRPGETPLERLFGLSPLGRRGELGPGLHPVPMATRHAGLLDVTVESAPLPWPGEPADCLLVRPAGEAGPREAARGLADTVRAARASDAEAALDAVAEAVATLDRAGRLLSLNRAAALLFRGEARELVGTGLPDLFEPADRGAVRALVEAPGTGAREARLAGSEPPESPTVSLVLTSPRADGRRILLLRRAEAGASSAAHDEARLAGARADYVTRLREGVRPPVQGILGSAGMILAEGDGPLGSDSYREALRDIRASGEELLVLIDELEELARIEAGRRDLAAGPLALNDLVAGCVAALQPYAARGRVVLRTSFSEDLPLLMADGSALRRSVLGLLAAAIRDTGAGGQVIVSTTLSERGEVTLRIRDTGEGLGEAEIAALMSPFAPRPAASGRETPGAAMGLSLMKALVEANRGRFRLTSRRGEGTLVEILFPLPRAMSA
ncbi:PAS domain-containing sensor histidine kinase [Methylobacterium sp. CG08_land_8_20_14_0_20_71_15]|uniref:sensor histidine kinase n=1 Tax=Methylobacterium sp. CG08_land_8_20_14_0_20_71_15 TaxID=1975531 RepID=UPI000CA82DDC|nr:PAS domain-containing sensor histidine kinase [Methylobacterium sp. CG08_land_8_20_14_0_20_71_15]PIU15492.1 MAG: PAS domain-containing sensor histidine kinase [Methylobacterium sp. CG08_land_8_20_14_0_20_71_15]